MSDELKKAIQELTEVVRGMGTPGLAGDAAIKTRVEEMERQLAAYKEMTKRGFIMPGIEPGMTQEEVDKHVFAPYNLAIQGKQLMDKFAHPNYQMKEENRLDVAKWWILFLKAAHFKDERARFELRERFHSKGTATDIGDTGNTFTVPTIVESEILAFAREQSVILQNSRIWPMTSDKLSIPAESGSAAVAWGETTGESNPSTTDVLLDADTLSAYAVVNNTTLEDTVSDIVSWLTSNMAEAAGQEIDNSGFNGDGTSTYGYCSGILSAACGYSVQMASGSTAFSQLTADHLSEMIAKLDGLRKVGAMFYMNGAVLHYVRTLKDNNNRPIFVDVYGNPLGSQVFGYPYREVLKITGTSGANTPFIAFGNLKYFAVGRRLNPMTLAVDPYGLWTTNKTRFKLRHRWALKIGLANGFCRLLTASGD